jgi:hypothetical protein
MLRNSGSKPRYIKLDRLNKVPGVRVLEDMRQRALVNAGAIVELPFGDDVQSFNLTVTRDTAHGSWMWMMYRDDGYSAGLEWSHLTHDADYIHNLINNLNLGFSWTKPVQAFPAEVQANPATATAQPTEQAPRGTLQGNLTKVQIANLFQSINMGQMTGRLEIVSPSDKATVYFSDGNPVHATMRGAVGTEAVIQMQGWQIGDFTFFDSPIDVTPTIKRGLISLLMEGATFVDHLTFLTTSGLMHDSYLVPVKNVNLKEALKDGVECELADLMSIYDKIDGIKTWSDIQRDLDLTKTKWVPVMFNLINCGLVRINNTFTKATRQTKAEDKMDWAAVRTFEQSISRGDSGLFTHPALLYFLSQEWHRYESTRHPFSLIIFGYCHKSSDSLDPQFIPFRARVVDELREKVLKTKRKYDQLCHAGAFSYAMLLPLTSKKAALRQAHILAEMCGSMHISEDFNNNEIEFRAGIANIPEDCSSLGELLTLAENVSALSQ